MRRRGRPPENWTRARHAVCPKRHRKPIFDMQPAQNTEQTHNANIVFVCGLKGLNAVRMMSETIKTV